MSAAVTAVAACAGLLALVVDAFSSGLLAHLAQVLR